MLLKSLAYDPETGDVLGDRIITSGWPVWDQAALHKAGTPTEFLIPGMGVIRVPAADPGQPISSVEVVNDQSIEPVPQPATEDYLGFLPMSGRRAYPSRRLLDEFLALARNPADAAVLTFARRWGSLGLRSQEPVSALGEWLQGDGAGERLLHRLPYLLAPTTMDEPIHLWRTVLAQIRAVVIIGDRLARGELGSDEEWQVLREIVQWPLTVRGRTEAEDETIRSRYEDQITEAPVLLIGDHETLDGQRPLLASVVQTWLALGALRLQMEWAPDVGRPILVFSTRTMFGGVVSELIKHLAAQHGLATCAGCGASFVPARQPRADRLEAHAIYCATCRSDRTARRAASSAWRARNPDYFKERRLRKSREKAASG